MKFKISHPDKLSQVAHQILKQGDTFNHAYIITLSGDLGVGKTALVKSCALQLEVEEPVTSPTFVIQKEYELKHDRYTKLIHIDAYRLKSKEDLEYLKFADLVSDSGNIIFIEWPSEVKGIDLPDALNVTISIQKGEDRLITLS